MNLKHFSIRNKLLLIFSAVVLTTGILISGVAVRSSAKKLKAEIHSKLVDKAIDTAEIIDGRLDKLFIILESIVKTKILLDENKSFSEKLAFINHEVKDYTIFNEIVFVDSEGYVLINEHTRIQVSIGLGSNLVYQEKILLMSPVFQEELIN